MAETYFRENAWWGSLYNDLPDVREHIRLEPKLEIHDATLRDGEQTPGVVFSPEDKVRIAERLSVVGVERIEAGMPAVSKADYKAVREICRRGFGPKIYAFARAVKDDIDMAVDCGAHGVVIEVPIGYPKLLHQFHWTWEKVLEKSVGCIEYAKAQGLEVVYFPYDTTRARQEDLENLLKGIMEAVPPDSVGLVDTVGCALPHTVEYLVRKMKKLTGLPIEVHTHNDFGMGVATEIAGLCAGASCVHSCVNGLGERTGNAALEELMMAMKLLLGTANNYKLDQLPALCEMVSRISGVPVAPNKPVTGARNYTRESGIGIDLVMKNPLAMFATNPEYFGRHGEVVLGKKSGKASVEYCLEQHGLAASGEQIAAILEQVKAKGEEKRGILTDEEFLKIVEDCR